MARLQTVLVLAVIVAAGIAIRCHAIEGRSLWFDEAFSWRMTRYPLAEMMDRVTRDVHPPLFYIVLKVWNELFGSSVIAMRLLSVVWSAMSVVGTFLFMRAAFSHSRQGAGERVSQCLENGEQSALALLAAALVATSIFQIRYAWEVRMYAQGTALAAFSNWALLRALRPPTRMGWWLFWVAISVAFAYTHYYALFTLAAQGLFVAGCLLRPGFQGSDAQPGRELVRTVSYAGLAAVLLVLLYLPWVKPFLNQRREVQESFWAWPIDRWTVPGTIYQMLGGGPASDTFYVHTADVVVTWSAIAVVVALGWLFWRGGGARFLVVSAVIPVALAVLMSVLSGRSIYSNRYFTFAHLSLISCAAAIIWKIPWRKLRWLAAGSAVALNVFLSASFISRLDIPNHSGARGAAEFLIAHAAEDEPVVIGNSRVFFPMLYYTSGHLRPRLLNVSERIEHFGGKQVLDPDDLVSLNELWDSRASSVWVIDTTGFGGVMVPVPPEWSPAETWVFPELFWWQGQVEVRRYVPQPDRPASPPPKDIEKLLSLPPLPIPG